MKEKDSFNVPDDNLRNPFYDNDNNIDDGSMSPDNAKKMEMENSLENLLNQKIKGSNNNNFYKTDQGFKNGIGGNTGDFNQGSFNMTN